jgi:hypothetical protein
MLDHGHDGVSGLAGTSLNVDMDVVDVQLELHERTRNWDLLLSGGVRYGRAGFKLPQLYSPNDAVFEGFGPTVSLSVTRQVGQFGCHGLYLIGDLRVSMVFGEVGLFGSVADDEITTVLENQLGVGIRREIGLSQLHLRGVWESQFWLNDTLADDYNGLGTNLGFSGPTVAIELRR